MSPSWTYQTLEVTTGVILNELTHKECRVAGLIWSRPKRNSGSFPSSRAGFLWSLDADTTAVKTTVFWITVVPGVVDAVFVLRLARETRKATAEANSRHTRDGQPAVNLNAFIYRATMPTRWGLRSGASGPRCRWRWSGRVGRRRVWEGVGGGVRRPWRPRGRHTQLC